MTSSASRPRRWSMVAAIGAAAALAACHDGVAGLPDPVDGQTPLTVLFTGAVGGKVEPCG